MAGSVWRIHTPPSSCIAMAYSFFIATMNASAPNFTTSDTTLATVASSLPVQSRRMNSR